MGRSGKCLTTSLTFSTKSLNKNQTARTAITVINNQYFRDFLKEFNNAPYLGYNKKQVNNELTETYLFLIKQVSKLIKIENHVWLHTKTVRSDVDEKNMSRK